MLPSGRSCHLCYRLVTLLAPAVITTGYQAAIADKLFVRRKPVYIPDLCQNCPGCDKAHTGNLKKAAQFLVEPDLSFNGCFQSMNMALDHSQLIKTVLDLNAGNLWQMIKQGAFHTG